MNSCNSLSSGWTVERAKDWHTKVGWLVGCNYCPAYAINQLEMWQAETYDLTAIKRELGWAAGIGFNCMRVFLHDLLYRHDRDGFFHRFDRFLDASIAHGITIMPVFFDSCWHPFPSLGPQRPPEPGVHNSGWVQSPGVTVLRDADRFDQMESYVREFVRRYRSDQRVSVWDVWNEPDNPNTHAYGPRDLGSAKQEIVVPLLLKAFEWVRSESPIQPLTSGIWLGNWSSQDTLRPVEQTQIACSDVISFHNYTGPVELESRIHQLARYERPMLCIEFMARGAGSTFIDCLPVLHRHRVGALCWGLVKGKTQTHLPWDSWQRPYVDGDPNPWFHEVFHPDGSVYDPHETALISDLASSRI